MIFESGLPLSPAPSPVPSVRRLRLQSPQQGSSSAIEKEVRDLFVQLPIDAQTRVLRDLLQCARREVLLEARSVLEPRLRHDPFKVLPIEISLRILSYINDPKSLAAAAQVSRRWYFLLRDDSTWKQMCHEHHFRRLSAAGSYIHQWRERGSSQALEDTPPPAAAVGTRRTDGSEYGPINGPGDTFPYQSDHSEPERPPSNPIDPTNTTAMATVPPPVSVPVSLGDSVPAYVTGGNVTGGSGGSGGSGNGGTGTRARRNSLLRLGSGADPLIQYGLRLPNWDRDMRRHLAHSADAEGDPIGEAYYDPRACVASIPDSYRSHFQQQYMQSQAWATGGRLAGRYSLPGHGEAIVTCVLMQDGYFVAALDTSLILVFHSDGQLVRSLYGHVMGVWTLALNQNVLISGGCDRDVREWDLNSGHCLKIMRGHTSTVRCLAMSNGLAVSGARDTTVRVWDLNRGQALHVLCGHSASVRRVDLVSHQGRDLAVSASYDSTAIVWDVETGAKLHTLQGHTNQIYALAVDSSRVITGSLDHTIRVWDLATGSALGVLSGHTALVGQLALRDSLLVSGGSDGSVRVWDLGQMRCTHRIAAHDNTVSCLSLAGDKIVTGGPDCQVSVWNVRTGELIRLLEKPSVTTVWAVSAQDDRLLTVYSEGSDVVIELMSFVPPIC